MKYSLFKKKKSEYILKHATWVNLKIILYTNNI